MEDLPVSEPETQPVNDSVPEPEKAVVPSPELSTETPSEQAPPSMPPSVPVYDSSGPPRTEGGAEPNPGNNLFLGNLKFEVSFLFSVPFFFAFQTY